MTGGKSAGETGRFLGDIELRPLSFEDGPGMIEAVFVPPSSDNPDAEQLSSGTGRRWLSNPIMARALFLSCSRRKVPGSKPMPAIDRYDGPCFRVLRRFLRVFPTNRIQVWIVSGKHGLIGSTHPIRDYDKPMTAKRAEQLRNEITEGFLGLWRKSPFDEAFASLGKNYEDAMRECWSALPPGPRVTFADGSIGCRCSLLKAWLYGGGGDSSATRPKSRLLGVPVTATREQALALAAAGLTEGRPGPKAFHTWYVPVNGRRVSAKWLVSEVTGIPASRFRTADARRVLQGLGITCRSCWPGHSVQTKNRSKE